MTKEQKLSVILKELPYSNIEIAQKLGINKTNLSHWQKDGNLKPYHYFALCFTFNIPIEIFENENITTKKQIIEILKNKDNKNTQNSPLAIHNFDKRVLNLLQGKWYITIIVSQIKFLKIF